MQKEVYEFISRHSNDPIVERKTCEVSGKQFPIFQSDLDFYDKISPVFNGKKYQIPTPRLCPEERHKRRLTWRNERNLYRRKCNITDKNIISMYSVDKDVVVCDEKVRRTDKIDTTKYGQDFDFSRPFFEQFDELKHKVPLPALHVVNNENSIINQCGYSKNSYLCFNADYDENCYYCVNTIYSKDCVDLLNAEHCELSAYSVDIKKSYKIFYSKNINNSNNIYFSQDLQGCEFCFVCKGLKNKKYHILNKSYSKQDYHKIIDKLKLGDRKIVEKLRNKAQNFFDKFPKEALHIENSSNSFGNEIYDSQNIKMSFDIFESQDVSYCDTVSYIKSSMDFNIGGYDCERCLDMIGSGDTNYNCLFCQNIWGKSQNLMYCNIGINSKNCFGCVGLKGQEYCILNKQYTKQEYEALVPRIIAHIQKTGERGEFFQSKYSPFAYNESDVQNYYTLSKSEAKKLNYKRRDANDNISISQDLKTINTSKLAENIDDVGDDILKSAIICDVSQKPFRLTKQELELYKKQKIPVPIHHPDVRYLHNLHQRYQKNLYLRACDKTGDTILSVYPPDEKSKIYSQKEYEKRFYN